MVTITETDTSYNNATVTAELEDINTGLAFDGYMVICLIRRVLSGGLFGAFARLSFTDILGNILRPPVTLFLDLAEQNSYGGAVYFNGYDLIISYSTDHTTDNFVTELRSPNGILKRTLAINTIDDYLIVGLTSNGYNYFAAAATRGTTTNTIYIIDNTLNEVLHSFSLAGVSTIYSVEFDNKHLWIVYNTGAGTDRLGIVDLTTETIIYSADISVSDSGGLTWTGAQFLFTAAQSLHTLQV